MASCWWQHLICGFAHGRVLCWWAGSSGVSGGQLEEGEVCQSLKYGVKHPAISLSTKCCVALSASIVFQAYFKNETGPVILWGFEEKSLKCDPSGTRYGLWAVLKRCQLLSVLLPWGVKTKGRSIQAGAIIWFLMGGMKNEWEWELCSVGAVWGGRRRRNVGT